MNEKTSCDYEAELVMCRKEMKQIQAECSCLALKNGDLADKLIEAEKEIAFLRGQVKVYEFAISKGVYTKCP